MFRLNLEDYLIKENGEIINKRNKKMLKPQLNGKGYLRVHIGGKRHFVHRLVAETFISNPNNYPQVNHKNGIKTDNRVENLEWCTNLRNRKHAIENDLQLKGENCSWAKLTNEDVLFIRNNKENYTKAEFSKMFNVSISSIKDVLYSKTWKNV